MTARRQVPERLVPFNLAELETLDRMVRETINATPDTARPLLWRITSKLQRAQRNEPKRSRKR